MSNSDKLENLRQSGQTFCPYLFLHYHLDTDKASKLCCHATYSINEKQIGFNDPAYNILRTKTLTGERLRSCNRCYEAEDNGFTSLRQQCIDDVEEMDKTDVLFDQVDKFQNHQPIDPLWYDLRLSNNCNLTCIMCGPLYSSTWAKKANQEDVYLTHESDVDISPNAYKIQLAGGEPFMIKKFSGMLSKVENLNCEILVNTNATIVTEPLLNQLKRFTSVSMIVSIDGYGQVNDRIRQGSNWNTIVKNIKLFQDSGFNVHINTVLQRDNINHMYDLGTFLESLSIEKWIISPLFGPDELRWENQKNINYNNLKRTAELEIVKRNGLTLLQHILKEKP